MLSTFLCHIVPYGRPWAVLELHWHDGYLKRSGKGQKRTQRPFVCVSLSVSRANTCTHSYLLNYVLWLCMSTLVCALHWCAHSVFVCVVFLCKQSLLCVCVYAHWHWVRAGTHWQMGHREAFYICWRICIVTATAARVSCLLSCCAFPLYSI